MVDSNKFFNASKFEVMDVWSKEKKIVEGNTFSNKIYGAEKLLATDNLTIVVTPVK